MPASPPSCQVKYRVNFPFISFDFLINASLLKAANDATETAVKIVVQVTAVTTGAATAVTALAATDKVVAPASPIIALLSPHTFGTTNKHAVIKDK